MTEENLISGVTIIAFVLFTLGLVVALTSCRRSEGNDVIDSHLEHYSSFTANGADYKSEDVIEYEYIPNGYQNDVIVFNMENGDEVHVLIDMITWHKN